jgi:hypothetical protein
MCGGGSSGKEDGELGCIVSEWVWAGLVILCWIWAGLGVLDWS